MILGFPGTVALFHDIMLQALGLGGGDGFHQGIRGNGEEGNIIILDLNLGIAAEVFADACDLGIVEILGTGMPLVEQEHTICHEVRPGGCHSRLVFQRIIGQVNHVPALGLVLRPGRIAGLNRMLVLQLEDGSIVFRHDLLVLLDNLVLLLCKVFSGAFPERIGDHRLDQEAADSQRRHQDGDDQNNRDSLTLFSLSAHELHLPLNTWNRVWRIYLDYNKFNASLRHSSQDCKNPSFFTTFFQALQSQSDKDRF